MVVMIVQQNVNVFNTTDLYTYKRLRWYFSYIYFTKQQKKSINYWAFITGQVLL